MKPPESGKKRILVVEDEIPIGNMCRRVLAGEDFKVDIAINGKVAQDMIKRKQYGPLPARY
jgi:DNA-binding response OmpR family regulator